MPPRTIKKLETSLSDEKQLKSKFFVQVQQNNALQSSSRSIPAFKNAYLHWKCVKIPQDIQVSSVLQRLRDNKQKPLVTETSQNNPQTPLQSLFNSQNIETVRKQNFFSEEVTEEEQNIIAQRVALQQRQFAEYERREKNRKSSKILQIFDYVNEEEIEEILQDCSQDEDEAIYRLTKPEYLMEIRKAVASNYNPVEENSVPTMNAAQMAAYQQLIKKRSGTLKKTTNDQAKKQYRLAVRLGLDEALQQVQNHQVDPEKAFEGWSQARIRAYQMIDQNPNSYYYRFNAPGEIQRKGQWTEEEKELFHERLREVGANGQWGIFSIKIPGRVGYQCSNYYRLLIETKKILDPNYVIDEKGKSHYLFDKKTPTGETQKTFRTYSRQESLSDDLEGSPSACSVLEGSSPKTGLSHLKHEPITRTLRSSTPKSPSSPLTTTATSTAKRVRRSRKLSSSEDESPPPTDRMPQDRRVSKRIRRPTVAALEASASCAWSSSLSSVNVSTNHPLPGFIDPITLEEVVKPAISKYGHVMGYDSWVRCLTSWEGKRNTCPLTKKPLTKRDLVILDMDNIEELRHTIVNL
ncbi:hypothetical protein BDF14DRAFT_1829766 [Spinellus fusiger]|nr:hypothetical protein BDF14DRAFT_1829766 [Spinellus fusiger]